MMLFLLSFHIFTNINVLRSDHRLVFVCVSECVKGETGADVPV